MGKPTIFPTGTTIYEPENCWNGFNLFAIEGMGIMLVDMNGNEVRFWKDVTGFPVKMLPNGDIMAYLQKRPGKFSSLEYKDLSQIDWDGNLIIWNILKIQAKNLDGKHVLNLTISEKEIHVGIILLHWKPKQTLEKR